MIWKNMIPIAFDELIVKYESPFSMLVLQFFRAAAADWFPLSLLDES